MSETELEKEKVRSKHLRDALHNIAHTFTEDSHGNTKTMPASYYQGLALRALREETHL